MSDELLSQYIIGDTLDADNSVQPITCVLCRRLISSDYESGDLEAIISICGDCKFLFLEDLETPTQEGYPRRPGSRRRRRFQHIENPFSQQFSHIIDLARNNQIILPEHDSLHTTPSGSRRWRRVISDTESEGFGSIYGDSESSNVSFTGYRNFHGDNSDTLSYSAYGGDSDASIDVLENETSVILDEGSESDSDTDIDPMHAGLYQWNSDDQEVEDEEDNESEENDDSIIDSWRLRSGLQRPINPSNRRINLNWRRQTRLASLDGNFEDVMNAREFDELLERLGENENARRGAPPASILFIKNLPSIIIGKDHENLDELACAICKDCILVGTLVNQLPCLHLYHPSCITPWLSSRSSCPLCRFELPTDDKEYESRKQRGIRSGLDFQEQDSSSPSDLSENDEGEVISIANYTNGGDERSSRRSFLNAAAAPIVSIVGIVIVLWLGNSVTTRRMSNGVERAPLGGGSNPRVRRWWSLF